MSKEYKDKLIDTLIEDWEEDLKHTAELHPKCPYCNTTVVDYKSIYSIMENLIKNKLKDTDDFNLMSIINTDIKMECNKCNASFITFLSPRFTSIPNKDSTIKNIIKYLSNFNLFRTIED